MIDLNESIGVNSRAAVEELIVFADIEKKEPPNRKKPPIKAPERRKKPMGDPPSKRPPKRVAVPK